MDIKNTYIPINTTTNTNNTNNTNNINNINNINMNKNKKILLDRL